MLWIPLPANLFMRLELLEQNSILYTKREFLFLEEKVFMKLLNVTSCHCIKIQAQPILGSTYLLNKYCESNLTCTDIVFNMYLDHSIKNSTRNK